MEKFAKLADRMKDHINERFAGNDKLVEELLITLVAGGNILLEGVPGIGKTTIAKSLCRSVTLDYSRIQFTPDTMPSDITGYNMYNQKTGKFNFMPGGVFSNIVLADEINRASPRVQSAMLEAMDEQQVTVDGDVHILPQPFMVLATQNPAEQYGTFPLPEAQLDRFLMKSVLEYMTHKDELNLLKNHKEARADDKVAKAVTQAELMELKVAVKTVFIEDSLYEYIMNLVLETRKHEHAKLGVSTRAALALVNACKARAVLKGRDYVTPEDIQILVWPILTHRIMVHSASKADGITPEQILEECLGAHTIETTKKIDKEASGETPKESGKPAKKSIFSKLKRKNHWKNHLPATTETPVKKDAAKTVAKTDAKTVAKTDAKTVAKAPAKPVAKAATKTTTTGIKTAPASKEVKTDAKPKSKGIFDEE